MEVKRVLGDGGLLLLALRMGEPNPKRFATAGLTAEQVMRVKRYVEDAGFQDVRTVERNVGRQVTGVLADK